MKKIINILFVLLFAGAMSSCNLFDPIDPDLNKLDRCQSLNDSGDFDAAIAACKEVDSYETNTDALIELADANLGALGVNLQSLSAIFLNQNTSTLTFVQLAEALLAKAVINADHPVESKLHAQDAVTYMKDYGALIGNTTEARQIAAFYEVLARVCQISVLLAYADIDSDVPNGTITRNDICPTGVSGCDPDNTSQWICDGLQCEGMKSADAGTAADSMIEITKLLTDLTGSSLNLDAVNEVLNPSFTLPDGTPVPDGIRDALVAAYKPAAGRRLLVTIARAN